MAWKCKSRDIGNDIYVYLMRKIKGNHQHRKKHWTESNSNKQANEWIVVFVAVCSFFLNKYITIWCCTNTDTYNTQFQFNYYSFSLLLSLLLLFISYSSKFMWNLLLLFSPSLSSLLLLLVFVLLLLLRLLLFHFVYIFNRCAANEMEQKVHYFFLFVIEISTNEM